MEPKIEELIGRLLTEKHCWQVCKPCGEVEGVWTYLKKGGHILRIRESGEDELMMDCHGLNYNFELVCKRDEASPVGKLYSDAQKSIKP